MKINLSRLEQNLMIEQLEGFLGSNHISSFDDHDLKYCQLECFETDNPNDIVAAQSILRKIESGMGDE